MPVGAWELEYGCNVVADPNRVAQYVANAQDPAYCTNGVNALAPYPLKFSTLRVNCDCAALQWDTTTPYSAPTPVQPYTTPEADFAPWYTATIPESAHFWGWMIEKVEEVAAPPISRMVTDRITEFGGASVGRLRRKGRTMRFTLIGFGGYELAMDYGFRWLTDLLTTENSINETCDATFRTSCPPIDDPPTFAQWDTGRWTFKDVGIIDGPHYEDPPNPDMQCNVRRVSFTVVAQVPYAFKCPLPVITNQSWITQLWSPEEGPCPPVNWICDALQASYCQTVSAGSDIGESSLVINVTALDKDISNLVISVTPNPLGYPCDSELLGPPCDSITVPKLYAWSTLVYDGTTQTIRIQYLDGSAVDGTPFISSGTTPPSFPSVRGGEFCVCISSDRCSWESDGAYANVWTVHRELAI